MNEKSDNIVGGPEVGQNLVPVSNPTKAQQLQDKIYLAAKKSRTRRFHQLYDKIHRKDFLEEAWKAVKANKGRGGIDGLEIEDIKDYGEEQYLNEIQILLKDSHKYHPRKIKRVHIPKPNGKKRPLGLLTIRDRIVQASAKSILELIFEADFLECSYGFRPGRSAHDALEEIRVSTNAGQKFVLDADIKGYFDNINHEKLLNFVQQRISDRKVLKLIRKWLKCGVVGEEEIQENKVGTPQGAVISPLLANIFLHEFDKFWTQQTDVNGKLIRFCDDFVILFATREDAERGLELVKAKLSELNLQLNPEKTGIVDMRNGNEGFDFLGFHIRQVWSKKYRKFYTQNRPKKDAMKELKQKITEIIGGRSKLLLGLEEMVKQINPVLRGWMNFFKFGNSSNTFNAIDRYVHQEMALWWRKKHGKKGRGWKEDYTYQKHKACGIVRMTGNVMYWSAR